MANTSTLFQRVPVAFSSMGYSEVFQYVVAFDTTGADLIVHSPPSDKMAALVGIYYAEADAHDLLIKSESTTLITLQMPASSGQVKGIGPGDGPLVITKPGEDLVLRCNTANVTSMICYVANLLLR